MEEALTANPADSATAGTARRERILVRLAERAAYTPAESAASRAVREPDYRIGVLTGTNSGGLGALDCDCDDFASEMRRLNSWLARTLTTTCNRGCTFWQRLTDRWPKTAALYWQGRPVGEWRADGIKR